MLSLLKRSSSAEKNAPAALGTIPWRPDFRDVSQLPDTKTVRTSFFVNTLAVAVTAALLLYTAQREWTIISLKSSIADIDTRVAEATPDSKRAQAAFVKFQAEEKKFNEAYDIVRDPFRVTNFIFHLGSTLPTGVTLKRIDYRGLVNGVALSAAVKGLDSAASELASSYVKQLQNDKVLAEHVASVTLTNLGRDLGTSTLNLELVLAFKTPAQKAAAKK
jgi:hypothetical protein